MAVQQALVAIGGSATRLRSTGQVRAITKSFIRVQRRPILHWCLIALHAAGIRRLVLAGNQQIHLDEANLVLSRLPVAFEQVDLFRDLGLGVHGLPYQAKRFLEPDFLFECGHSLMWPSHYQKLIYTKQDREIVFSAFRPHASNLRQRVQLLDNALVQPDSHGAFAVAHPFVLDHAYADLLPAEHFQIGEMLRTYADRRRLRYVLSSSPPEFDLMDEYRASRASRRAIISCQLTRGTSQAITGVAR